MFCSIRTQTQDCQCKPVAAGCKNKIDSEFSKCIRKKWENSIKVSKIRKQSPGSIETELYVWNIVILQIEVRVILSGYLEKGTWFTLRFWHWNYERQKEKKNLEKIYRHCVVGIFLFLFSKRRKNEGVDYTYFVVIFENSKGIWDVVRVHVFSYFIVAESSPWEGVKG